MISTSAWGFQFATRAGSSSALSMANERRAIGLNLAQCRASQSRWFRALRAGDAVRRFLAVRLITTVVVVVAIGALGLAFT